MNIPTAQANVTSYLALNWASSYERPRALMVNPDAHHLELLAWCWGEVQSLLASADTCIAGASEMGTGDLSAIFVSRLGPLSEVLTIAVDAAMKERMQMESATVVEGAPMSKAANLAPTSELPFAARHCDVPYLDLIKNHRAQQVKKLEDHANAGAADFVQYAWRMASVGDRMSQIDDLLLLAESLFEKSHRGDAADMSPVASFQTALGLLGLSRELLEGAGLDADEALDGLCEVVMAASAPPITSKASTPAT